MAEIKLFEGHVESIKELRKQLSDLKDAYAALASEETKDTDKMAAQLNEVAKAQDLLNDVMGNTRNAVSEADRALAQNYNTMQIGDKTVNQLRADLKMLTAVLNDTKPGPGWDELNQKVLEVNNALKGMEQSHGDFRRSVGSYAKIFDNFEQGANQVKQAGADIQGALNAIAGAMNLTKEQQDDLNGAMNQFQGALQIIGGAKGVAGLLKNLKTWLTTTKAQTTTQKAQNAGINGFTAATNAAAVAEGKATVATSIWSAVLNALPFVAIATAIGVLITHFEDIVGWIQNLLEKWHILHKQEEDNVSVTERLTKKFDEQNKELERRQKLDKAKGVSNTTLLQQQKEQYAQQIKDIEAEKVRINLDIQRMEGQSAWVKFWNRSRKKINEANDGIKALDEMIASLKSNMEDIDIDIQVENITAGNNAKANAAKTLEQQNETLKKAAEAAASEIKKIYDNTLNPVETVKQTYDEIRKKLKEGEDAELKLAGENQEKITEITEKYSNARSQLAIQEGVETNKAYREMFNKSISGFKSVHEVVQAFKDNEGTYKQALESIFGENINQYDNEWKNLGRTLNFLKEEYDTIIETVGKTDEGQMNKLLGMTTEEIKRMYEQALLDEEAFIKQYGQPFSEAIKLLGENIVKQQENLQDRTIAHVSAAKEAVEQAFDKNNVKDLSKAISDMLSLEEIANDPALREGAEKYAARVKKEFVKGILENGGPNEINDTFFSWLNEGLNGSISKAKEKYNDAKAVFDQVVSNLTKVEESTQRFEDGIYKAYDNAITKTEEYKAALASLNEAEAQLHKAREERALAYSQIAEKYMETYGRTAENLLTNVAGYWETTLKIKDDNLKKDLEQGKISQQEYDKQHERNRKSFEQMKKLQVAAAVISTAGAIVQALADTSVPNFYLRLANSIAAGLAGAAQIATINATSLDNAGGGGGSSAPQLVDRSATVQTVGMNPADYADAQAQNPVKVYVTDHDIEEGLNRSRARVEETSW